MSYNPAFVSDESLLANSSGANHDQTNGIKLLSFKVLPKVASNQDVVLNLEGSNRNNQSSVKRRANKSANQQVAPSNGVGNNEKNAISNKIRPAKTNLCTSTSSSLSLIDNPTLSSLTPSASSYSTTASSSSIESSGLCAAVECRDMRYDVGRGRNQKTILYNINVTVPEGSIYGLLGPSGCGKTTMLRCVVGRIKPKEGYVSVFGYRPNDAGSQIPGPAIGYMPQVSLIAIPGAKVSFSG